MIVRRLYKTGERITAQWPFFCQQPLVDYNCGINLKQFMKFDNRFANTLTHTLPPNINDQLRIDWTARRIAAHKDAVLIVLIRWGHTHTC